MTHVRARAREPFTSEDEEPLYSPYDPTNWPLVDLSGDDGQVTVYVQTIANGEVGAVFSTTFVRDTVAPEIVSLGIEPTASAIDSSFTNQPEARATLVADSGDDGTIAVAPLAPSKLLFADSEPSEPPTADYTSCPYGSSCSVSLPVDGDYPTEGAHDLYGFACDLAGNCTQEPASASIV